MLDYKYSNLSNSKSDEYLKSLSKNKKKKFYLPVMLLLTHPMHLELLYLKITMNNLLKH